MSIGNTQFTEKINSFDSQEVKDAIAAQFNVAMDEVTQKTNKVMDEVLRKYNDEFTRLYHLQGTEGEEEAERIGQSLAENYLHPLPDSLLDVSSRVNRIAQILGASLGVLSMNNPIYRIPLSLMFTQEKKQINAQVAIEARDKKIAEIEKGKSVEEAEEEVVKWGAEELKARVDRKSLQFFSNLAQENAAKLLEDLEKTYTEEVIDQAIEFFSRPLA